VFSDLRLEGVVRFVDVGGIVAHLCLNFLSIIKRKTKNTTLSEHFQNPIERS